MSSLSEEKKKSIKEVFGFFDLNDAGRLSKEDFESALKSLGLFIPKKELDEYLSKTPSLDYEHFENLCASKMTQTSNKNDIIKAFEFLDPKLTGKASSADIKKAFMKLGEPMKENEVDDLIKDYIDDKGMIEYKKLVLALVGK